MLYIHIDVQRIYIDVMCICFNVMWSNIQALRSYIVVMWSNIQVLRSYIVVMWGNIQVLRSYIDEM